MVGFVTVTLYVLLSNHIDTVLFPFNVIFVLAAVNVAAVVLAAAKLYPFTVPAAAPVGIVYILDIAKLVLFGA